MRKAAIVCLLLVLFGVCSQAQAQSPRDAFQAAVAAYQQEASEAAVEKLAALYKQLTPAPAVPEEAEFHAQKGAAFVKLAKTPADYRRAAQEFQAAIAVAPWVGEYHYNLAICYKSAEQFPSALASLKFAQILARDDKERRDALGLRAEIEAAQEMVAAQKAKDLAKAQTAKARNLILPGIGMGEVRLGMTESEVISALGAPSKRSSGDMEGRVLYLDFSILGISAVSEDRRISTIILSRKGMVTTEGVGIGTSRGELSAALGAPYRTYHSHYNDNEVWCYRGIQFLFDGPQSSVTSITIRTGHNNVC